MNARQPAPRPYPSAAVGKTYSSKANKKPPTSTTKPSLLRKVLTDSVAFQQAQIRGRASTRSTHPQRASLARLPQSSTTATMNRLRSSPRRRKA